MDIKQLCKLTSEYDSNIMTIRLRKSDLDFYTQQWKKDALNAEIETITKRQIEIRDLIFNIAPSVTFTY